MPVKIQAVRGTRDIMAPFVEGCVRLEKISRELAGLWGFKEIRTPTFEEAALFEASVGATTDIVQKEMYVFQDRGGRMLALRPEGTASVVRAYLENNLYQKDKNCRFFYIANMFRAERPQAGRFREFEQIGFEILGDESAAADAELISLAWAIFKNFGIKGLELSINSLGCPDCRGPYRSVLKETLSPMMSRLCEDCQKRFEKNPWRVLDCKVCSGKVSGHIPPFKKCAACEEHEKTFEALVAAMGISFKKNPLLARGLDYYTRTVFEFSSPLLGSQSALCGGGRYDGLVELLGGPKTPATGFALGVDRTIEAADKQNEKAPLDHNAAVFLVFAQHDSKTVGYGLRLAQFLRENRVTVFFSSPFDSLKSQMRQAGKSQVKYALIVGEEEYKNECALLKDLAGGSQSSVSLKNLIERLTC